MIGTSTFVHPNFRLIILILYVHLFYTLIKVICILIWYYKKTD